MYKLLNDVVKLILWGIYVSVIVIHDVYDPVDRIFSDALSMILE